jgi:hypothetical protein
MNIFSYGPLCYLGFRKKAINAAKKIGKVTLTMVKFPDAETYIKIAIYRKR